MAAVALVQGSSRGLGLEFCRYLLLNKSPAAVIATCRNPDAAHQLSALSAQHAGRMTVLRLDVNREEDIKTAAESVKSAFGKVDLIINSSAMLHPSGKGETSLRDVSAQVSNVGFLFFFVGRIIFMFYGHVKKVTILTGYHFYFDH